MAKQTVELSYRQRRKQMDAEIEQAIHGALWRTWEEKFRTTAKLNPHGSCATFDRVFWGAVACEAGKNLGRLEASDDRAA